MTPTCALLLGLLPLCLACLPAADADTSAVVTPPGEKHVYKQVDGKPLSLELYRPAGKAGLRPGVIFFHGGGWTGGTLDQFRYACQYFASRGMVAATVEYRMLTKDSKTAEGLSYKAICVTDAKSAIRWLKQHAVEFDLDPKRLVAGGGSAGGHIAVLATNHPGLDDPQDPPGIDTAIVAYVLFNPAFSAKDEASPEIDVARQLKAAVPPTVMFFGTKDEVWKPGGDAFAALLRQRGGSLRYWLAAEQKHGFFNKQPWCDATLAEADRFLVAQGLLSGTSPLTPTATLTPVP